ncbi:toxin C-terminal domain-containing protein [Kribbella sp. DT2]|uniref:toxin C-terminal domain-containing protein n=1 Tax=Kribbella sp. DT2 TaxID=3393427 RepID=UPI003CEEE2D2
MTGRTPVLVHNDNCNPISKSQAADIAHYLGYKENGKLSAANTPILEHGKPGRGLPRSVTWDRTAHKGGIFKGANFKDPFRTTKKSGRDGTYDLDVSSTGEVFGLKWIAD